MIYLDSSVALAQLLSEDRTPREDLWEEPLVASRLLEYEVWNAIHRRRLDRSHGEEARRIVGAVAIVELSREVLRRATEPFPTPVRTLDALHLASMLFLIEQGIDLQLASYDHRLLEAANALEIELAVPD